MLPLDQILENRLGKFAGIGNWNPLQLFGFGQAPSKRGTDKPHEPVESDPDRPKIGLALSSGAAKGLAHIGVIQVLEENGIPIDAIAATSMGAYVAACWSSGLDGEELEALAGEIQTSRDRVELLDPVFPPRRGFLRGDRVRNRLRKVLGDLEFEDLDRELYVIATEMGTYEAHVFHEGPVVEAVHASLAIPGIFTPVSIDGKQFVDGGVSDPLPVRALLDAGMDKIIAISVIPTVEELRKCREASTERDNPDGWMRKTGQFLNRHLNYFARGNILDVLRNSAMGSQIRVAEHNGALADVYLRPIVCTGSWHDYHNYRYYIAEGRAVAEANIERIRALIDEPTPALGNAARAESDAEPALTLTT